MAYHVPVMLKEILTYLMTNPSGTYLDCTLGGAGHSRAILERLSEEGKLVCIDRDAQAIEQGKEILGNSAKVKLIQSRFSEASDHVNPNQLDGALFDLGVSSKQIDDRQRGFSFEENTPLDMRMNPDEEGGAWEYLKSVSEEDLAWALKSNSDIQASRKMAREIKQSVAQAATRVVILSEKESSDTENGMKDHSNSSQENSIRSDLLRVAVERSVKLNHNNRSQILARVFQAIRMEVNDELNEIRTGLNKVVHNLKPGGRICVLSYHSVEDRAVKETFALFERDCICPSELPVCQCGSNHKKLRKVLRKPLTATTLEIKTNPRARSAKLRVMEKVL